MAVICDPLLTVKPVAFVPPNLTDVASLKPLPLMVTLVPPATGPRIGETELTEGRGI